jgi:hypothetical protein
MEDGGYKQNLTACWRRKISEKLRLPFYTREQRYNVEYKVRIFNESDFRRDYQLILPAPQETDYQTIIHQPVFKPEGFRLMRDSAYGNVAALYGGEIEAKGYAELIMKFEVAVKPRDIGDGGDVLFRSHLCKHVKTRANSNNYKNFVCEQEYQDVLLKLKCLNDKVVKQLYYGNPIPGLYTADQALDLEKVDCGGFDSLLAALAIDNNMEARIVSGFWAGYEKNTMHAWLEVKLPDGKIVPLDPSVEHLAQLGRTKKSGGFGYLGSDRIVFAVGCCLPFSVNGQEIKIDLLQHPYLMPHDPDLRCELHLNVKRL